MSKITVEVEINTDLKKLWSYLEDISKHVEWMQDATEIRFITERKSGVGTRFECDTKVGPFKLTDIMEITTWSERKEMGVKHSGVVTGEGTFYLRPINEQSTLFSWEETLHFPLWMGGKIGSYVAKPILTAIWKRNLKKLKQQIE